jgi:hypothetical protein
MTMFRLNELAEMARELEDRKYRDLLGDVGTATNGVFAADNWDAWLRKWHDCSPESRDAVFRGIFDEFRQSNAAGWWHVWLLMFKNDLLRLCAYFKPRVKSADERWSLVVCSFLDVVWSARGGTEQSLSEAEVLKRVKSGVARSVREDSDSRRRMRLLSRQSGASDRQSEAVAESGDDSRFEYLCRRVGALFERLSPLEQAILREICLERRTQAFCASHLGMSPDQVKRRLSRIKSRMARSFGPPFSPAAGGG